MARQVKPSTGLYTASEAIKKLKMPQATFHNYVKTGKIKKVTMPGKTEGFYEKAYIDKMAEAQELFALQYAAAPAEFSVAKPDDVQGIYDVMAKFWGMLYIPTVEQRLAWYQVNPEIDYVVKREGIVTGYITLLPLKPETMQKLMAGEIGTKDLQPTDILPFTPGNPLECWLGLAVKPGVFRQETYGIYLISGMLKKIQELAERGINIAKLYAKSETPDGIRMSKHMGFEDITPSPNQMPRQFVLDLETSESPYAESYREILSKGTQSGYKAETAQRPGVKTLSAHRNQHKTDSNFDSKQERENKPRKTPANTSAREKPVASTSDKT
ncbi:MAG TPA: hypothetical protein VNE61_11365 [Ktedonobacteraceae bacterium]|nr:hypothetical protein [Ktedonobacteraceae bacterium]